MRGVETFTPSGLDDLIAPLKALEMKMDVKSWSFSEANDTIENASQLARSEYYGEWRKEVQRFFDAVNYASREPVRIEVEPTRLIMLILPKYLPVDPLSAWNHWDARGHEIRISGDSSRLCELAMKGLPNLSSPSKLTSQQGEIANSDLWLIDADGTVCSQLPSSWNAGSVLNYAALRPFRDRFLAELNKAPKDIHATDEIISTLRIKAWDGWGLWPAALAGNLQLRRFVIDLFLSGNGAVIFSNSFVEWAASEALRRARPQMLVARFGARSKPKLFTSIAIFENQQKISSLPDVDDLENSAIDAAILARYVWLAISRYPEQKNTICLCVSEFGNIAYMILPEEKGIGRSPERTMAPEELYSWLAEKLRS